MHIKYNSDVGRDCKTAIFTLLSIAYDYEWLIINSY